MNWIIIAQLIAQYGFPMAEALFKKWESGGFPTQADFDELRELASQTAQDRAEARLVAAGIPLDDPRAIELLKLTQPE